MECVDEREQSRFIKWAHRLDVLALAPELGEMFYWMSCAEQGTAASGQSGALNDRIYLPALLVLVNKTTDTGLALEFNSASRAACASQGGWLRHLKDEAWSAQAVFGAEEARMFVMRHLGKKLPPL
jgi:hypothetical protein